MSDLDKSSDNTPVNDPDNGDLGNEAVGDAPENTFKAITSQEDFDKAIARRVNRIHKQYEGFEDFKTKASQLEKLEAEKGSDLEKLTRRAEKAEKDLAALTDKLSKAERLELVRDIADELGLPKKLVKRVQGDSEEDIRSDIEDLLEGLPSSNKPDGGAGEAGDKKQPPSQSPKQKMTFTATGDESDSGSEVSADDVLKDISGA